MRLARARACFLRGGGLGFFLAGGRLGMAAAVEAGWALMRLARARACFSRVARLVFLSAVACLAMAAVEVAVAILAWMSVLSAFTWVASPASRPKVAMLAVTVVLNWSCKTRRASSVRGT